MHGIQPVWTFKIKGKMKGKKIKISNQLFSQLYRRAVIRLLILLTSQPKIPKGSMLPETPSNKSEIRLLNSSRKGNHLLPQDFCQLCLGGVFNFPSKCQPFSTASPNSRSSASLPSLRNLVSFTPTRWGTAKWGCATMYRLFKAGT